MHCIEVKAQDFMNFRQQVQRQGGEVSIVSRYQDKGIRILDVEVSKDTRAINRLERVFGFTGV